MYMHSVQSVQDGTYELRKYHTDALHTVSQKFPQSLPLTKDYKYIVFIIFALNEQFQC